MVLIFGLQILPAQANTKLGVYEFRFYFAQFPIYFEFAGITEMSEGTTNQIESEYGSFNNVTTIEHAPFTMSGSGLDGTLSFKAMKTYIDTYGREIGSFNIMEFNITGIGSFRIEMHSFRGNFIGSYPSLDEIFEASPGTIWNYSYEEMVSGDFSSQDTNQPQLQNPTNDQGPPDPLTNKSIVIQLENFETKTVTAGTFDCVRLNESSYENGTYTGSRILYRTLLGSESLLVLQEDYSDEGKRMFSRELISLDPSQTSYVTSDTQISIFNKIVNSTVIFLIVNAKFIIILVLGVLSLVLVRYIRSRRKRNASIE